MMPNKTDFRTLPFALQLRVRFNRRVEANRDNGLHFKALAAYSSICGNGKPPAVAAFLAGMMLVIFKYSEPGHKNQNFQEEKE